ncbi:Peptide deformylase [Streptococcus sp. HSISM1]|nr:Peptide deformylase [Streptococcus sp. HSISM1]
MSGLYYADFISFYSPTQLCGGGTTKSNSNELPISLPLSLSFVANTSDFIENMAY